jgi:GPH family glycoside/pentoside/hexuronide:cation symporter
VDRHNAQITPPAARLSWREKVSYGVADMGFNFYWANIATFLTYFYTDVFGITAAAAASMLAIIKIVNACTDPLMAAIADRTDTRWGKFRPWLLWMALPLACAGVLTYTTPDLSADGKLVWAYATYLLLMVCYTGINIPYNALSGVISSAPQERADVNGARFLAAFIGSTIVTAASLKLVKWLGAGDERAGWQATMVVWGVAASAMFLITFLNTRERIKPIPGQQGSVLQDLRDLTRNRPWVVLFVLALVIMVSITLRGTTAIYYFKYYVGRPDLVASFVPSYMAAAAAGAALSPVMTRLIDKKHLLILLMTCTAALSCGFYFVPKDAVGTMFALQIGLGFVMGPKSPLCFAMYADTADYNEWKTGRRATAMTFAAATFSQKLGTAVAVAVIGWVFTSLGYVANAAQTSGSLHGILLLMSFIPGAFALAAAGVMLFYGLDAATLKRVQHELAERKAAL